MMKRFFTLLTALAALIVAPVQAQENMVIEKTDGTLQKVDVSQIKRVYFEGTEAGAVSVTVADFIAAQPGDTQYQLTGIITKVSNVNYGNVYLRDYTGEVFIYGIGSRGDFAMTGLKEGDIVTLVGKRTTFNDTPEMTGGQYVSHISVNDISIADFLKAPDSPDVYYRVTGTITEIANTTYGNLYLSDGTNSLYVYGCYPGYGATGDARKNLLANAGIAVGDQLTVIGTKTTYKETIELYNGIYFSHTKGTVATTLYREPYTVWGADKAQVSSYMTGYELYQEADSRLIYLGKDKELMTMYVFDNAQLRSSLVMLSPESASFEAIDTQLKGNYGYVSGRDSTWAYLSQDLKTAVILELDEDGYYTIQYIDYEWLTQQATQDDVVFEAPYTVWGADRETVKKEVSAMGYTLMGESNEASDNYYLAYAGKHKEGMSMYMFDSTVKLAQVSILFESSDLSTDDAQTYLKSNLSYTYAGSNTANGMYFYLSADGKTYAIVTSNTSTSATYTIIMFVSYDSVSSSAAPSLSAGAAASQTAFSPRELPAAAMQQVQFERLVKGYKSVKISR